MYQDGILVQFCKIMELFTEYFDRVYQLFLTMGWWIIAGLTLSALLWRLPQKLFALRGAPAVLLAVLGGAVLPLCNFAAVPIAVGILKRGGKASTALSFLCAASLLNPSSVLLAWAYMGMKLSAAYVCAAFLLALLMGLAAERLHIETSSGPTGFWAFISRLSLWVVCGILLQALLQDFFPVTRLLLDPQGTSPLMTGLFALCRHMCIPDDISLAASLAASGMAPGSAVLLLLLGAGSNLPELVSLWQMGSKKTAIAYFAVIVAGSAAAFIIVQLVMGAGFVPQYSLAEAEKFVSLSNALSIKTWMPARIPCAAALLLLGLYGLINVFSKLPHSGQLEK